MPRASPTLAIVLAVNIPAQLPSPGQAAHSIAVSSSSLIAPTALAPTASNTDVMSRALPSSSPGMIVPP